jgi:predicted transposase/invertase (TIGR01784 family)
MKDDGEDYVVSALNYLLDQAEISNVETFLRTIEVEVSPQVGERIMTAAQQLEARGRIEGQLASQREIAKRLLKSGMEIEKVRSLTELTQDEIEELVDA